MVRIYVVDNGGQWTHREWRRLRDLNVETKIIPNNTPFDELMKFNLDGLVLSGGAPRIGIQKKLGRCGEYLEKLDMPILGICAGHQFMAHFFGGEVKPSKVPEFGKVELTLEPISCKLIEGLPKKSIVWESHNDEVTVLPNQFELLGKSDHCKIQAMIHMNRPLYGLQFHPEVEHTVYGEQIFQNFIDICTKN